LNNDEGNILLILWILTAWILIMAIKIRKWRLSSLDVPILFEHFPPKVFARRPPIYSMAWRSRRFLQRQVCQYLHWWWFERLGKPHS
jgi:hypothetical protein